MHTLFSAISCKRRARAFLSLLRLIILGSWLNLLLILIAPGFVLHYTGARPWITLLVNFIAAIPCVAMLSYGSNQLVQHLGTILGALVSNTLGCVDLSEPLQVFSNRPQ